MAKTKNITLDKLAEMVARGVEEFTAKITKGFEEAEERSRSLENRLDALVTAAELMQKNLRPYFNTTFRPRY